MAGRHDADPSGPNSNQLWKTSLMSGYLEFDVTLMLLGLVYRLARQMLPVGGSGLVVELSLFWDVQVQSSSDR